MDFIFDIILNVLQALLMSLLLSLRQTSLALGNEVHFLLQEKDFLVHVWNWNLNLEERSATDPCNNGALNATLYISLNVLLGKDEAEVLWRDSLILDSECINIPVAINRHLIIPVEPEVILCDGMETEYPFCNARKPSLKML